MRRRKRRPGNGISTFKAGLIGIVLIVAFSYAVYTKFANPFANPYTIHATFSSANGLQSGSLVRIAGVDVGKVTGVSLVPGCHSAYKNPAACRAADVTMEIDNNGLPLHRDATFAIRPRIFLEGNFFVDVSPGTPSAPIAPSGHTFPIQQGVEPVQLDQVLTGLDSNTRQNLQTLIQQYGKAVKIGGPAYNRSIQFWLPAYKYTSLVAHDALGIEPNDLSNYIAAQGKVAGAFNAHPEDLRNLITDFNTTANAFAREDTALRNTVIELPRTLSAAIPAFNALNAAFPPLRELAVTLLPGVKSTGPTIDATLPFITQLRLLVQPSELQGLTKDLRPTIPALARLTNATIPLMRNEVRPASSCVANVIFPWSQLTVPDSHFNASNGFPPHKVFVEAVDYLPGLAGESRNFDANGPLHPRARGRRHADLLAAAGPVRPVAGAARRGPAASCRPTASARRTSPTCRARRSLRSPTCRRRASGPIHQVGAGSPLPTLAESAARRAQGGRQQRAQGRRLGRQDGRSQGPSPEGSAVAMKRAIKTHAIGLRGDRRAADPVARGRRLRAQPRALPVPVHPGGAVHDQRRVLDRAGGDPGPGPVGPGLRRADRTGGRRQPQQRDRDRPDADRPQVQEPDPHQLDGAAAAQDGAQGHVHRARAGAGRARRSPSPGSRSRSRNTNPDIDVDEILSSLDADTRSYLQLLVNGAGLGLQHNGGSELAQVLERFEPTHRDLARVNEAVGSRGRGPAPADQLAAAAEHRAGDQSDPDRAARRLERQRCSTRSRPRTATSRAR